MFEIRRLHQCHKFRNAILNSLAYFFAFILLISARSVLASSIEASQALDKALAERQPLVAHVVVALCDNLSQGIFPVSPALGNGDSPRTNLYWGALYGVKTYFNKHPDWQRLAIEKPENPKILERIAFRRAITRGGEDGEAIVIADAWRGKNIQAAIEQFLLFSAGKQTESFNVGGDKNIQAGGAAHLVAYVGHNGLMEFSVAEVQAQKNKLHNSAVILACRSDDYFAPHLQSSGAHKLLTTSGLMAPEAYTLEVVVSAWFAGKSVADSHEAAAKAYSSYQKANLNWARKLFISSD